jgi:hypothetical protein
MRYCRDNFRSSSFRWRVLAHAGRIRVITAVKARFGQKIAGDCWRIPKWQGFIEVFLEPAIVPEQPTIEFRVADSNLLDQVANATIRSKGLTRLTYVAYNGGPGYFERYRKRPGAKAVHQVATAFWQKHQAMKGP